MSLKPWRTDLATPDARRERTLRVAGVVPAAENIVLVCFEAAGGGNLPEWEPGDHLEVVLPSSLIRHYSLCGTRLTERRTRSRSCGSRTGAAVRGRFMTPACPA
jgi:hypothetical protein